MFRSKHTRLKQNSACFGCCCSKSVPVIAVDEPSKRLRIQGRLVTKHSVSDDFLSTTTCDIDLGAIQSQKSISSVGSNIQTEFVNHGKFLMYRTLLYLKNPVINTWCPNGGLLRWNRSRLRWVDQKKSENRVKTQEPVLRFHYSITHLICDPLTSKWGQNYRLDLSMFSSCTSLNILNLRLTCTHQHLGNGWILGGHMGA
ncbi:hypothetical protein CTI12_AA152410 [Artemisia annua]|uniref:Uncharacterized protein n=1 Tax=Artemisia annua TaxID=35608 RepID=A0A2U1N1N2_ARTAN|nr:hypothetical protein CTI12_AA152410 [Artemisia annua]